MSSKWFAWVAVSGLVLGLVLGLGSTAGANPMNWEGTFSAQIADFPALGVTGGGVATINDSSGVIPAHLQTLRLKGSRGNVAGTRTALITDPDTLGNGVFAIVVAAEAGTGTFAPISGGASSGTTLTRNVLPIRGVARICVVNTSCAFFLPLVLTQATANGAAVGVGIGGLLTVGGDSPIRISLEAAPWTIKNASAIDEITTTGGLQSNIVKKAIGFAHSPASGTTSTAQISGVVQLVSPAQIKTNLPLGSSANLAGLATYIIHFIPEPGLLMLLGSGVAGLVLLGRNRMRR